VKNTNFEREFKDTVKDSVPEIYDTKEEDGINFFDLFAVIWHRKIMIIVITMLAMIGVAVFLMLSIRLPPEISPLPNLYISRAFMLITEGRAPAGSRETLLGHGSRGSTYAGLALFLLRSNALLDSVIDDFNQIGRYVYNGRLVRINRGILREGLGPSHNDVTGVLSISFTHTDPIFAHDIVNLTVIHLENRFAELGIDRNRAEQERLELHLAEVFQNILLLDEERRRLEQSVAFIPLVGGNLPAIMADINRATMESDAMRQVYTQLRIQQEVLRANIAAEVPMLQVLELAEVPSRNSEPNRVRIFILVTFVAGIFSVLFAFVLEAISNIRKDPIAMAKLRRRRDV